MSLTSFKNFESKGKYEAYVDGSYINTVGWGFIVLHNGKEIYKKYGHTKKELAASIRNVAGELIAVGKLVQWCINNNVDEITVYYDYVGIQKWADDEWEARNPFTKRYKQFITNTSVKINWVKVKAHSGNKYNDIADQLAKQGAQDIQNTVDYKINDKIGVLKIFVKKLIPELEKASNFEAIEVGVLNDQFYRFEIQSPQGNRLGFLDIYNTTKKFLNPVTYTLKSHPQIRSEVHEIVNTVKSQSGL